MNLGAAGIWYAGLAPRDRRILRIGGIAVLLILLLWLVIPLQRNLMAAREHLKEQQGDLEWMREAGPTLAAAGPGIAAASNLQPGQLLVLIDTTVRESGLGQALVGSQIVQAGGVRAQLENADFNLLVGWMSRLTTQHGLKIGSSTITGGGTPGIVNAAVLIRAADPAQ